MDSRAPSTPPPDEIGSARSAGGFWRSLDELAGREDFLEALAREFPREASVFNGDAIDRRRLLQLMAAPLALAAMSGCTSPPAEQIVPYVRSPQGVVAGGTLHFATAMPAPDGALPLVVTSHEGRPTKIEGNELHPASLGATNAQAQASILTLYDPDRSQTVKHRGEISTWSAFRTVMRDAFSAAQRNRGAGVRILSEPITSPTLARQKRELAQSLPEARWHQYTPVHRDAPRAAARQVFGEDLAPIYQLREAQVVVSLDADFLTQGGGAVRYARDFMAQRDLRAGSTHMNRLYVIESSFSPTGAVADHRLALPPSDIVEFARDLQRRLRSRIESTAQQPPASKFSRWTEPIAEDLAAGGVVIVGDHQSALVHALAYAMNQALGAYGSRVRLISPIYGEPIDNVQSLGDLVTALEGDRVELLIILEGNPVYNAPAGVALAAALGRARQRVHLSLYEDETSRACQWHVPAAHYLESWSDARTYDGSAVLVQPLIAPLYGGKTVHELLLALTGSGQSGYEAVRATWQEQRRDGFESFWEKSLHDGVIADSAPAGRTSTNFSFDADSIAALEHHPSAAHENELELVFLPDPSVHDGRYANNGWLQELPKPITKLTWDNAALLSPKTAERLELEDGDMVELTSGERTITAPVWRVPGHADDCVTLHFGYGRQHAGRAGNAAGFSAYQIWSATGELATAKLHKTERRASLASTQRHFNIDDRNIVHSAALQQYRADPTSVLPHEAHHEKPSLYPDVAYEGFAWGMAIDLNKCTGCNACVVACQAENNIPIVGKEQVAKGREMHWLRIDGYFLGEAEAPRLIHQPMLCQHCERAPCEVVCPVAATTHSSEGLNEMTYNRCIGTRYCSNNCPYKVRRFNFLAYNDEKTPVLKLLRNPEVTVRSRGVMEKCTYCVQRINHARIAAKEHAVETGDEPRVPDGTLKTACQAACPTQAIVFGDINDPASEVTKLKQEPRNYGVLSELGTVPRTTYLAHVYNPNPKFTESRP